MESGQLQLCGWCKVGKGPEGFSPSYWGKRGTWCRACHAAKARDEMPPRGQHEPRNCEQCGKRYVPRQLKSDAAFCSFVCGDRFRKESGQTRDRHLRRKYGITARDYDRLLAEQGGGCALCGVKPEELTAGRYRTYLHVDHDHETNDVRGLLCPEHNLLLGRFGDSVEMFRKVVEYLEAHASI